MIFITNNTTSPLNFLIDFEQFRNFIDEFLYLYLIFILVRTISDTTALTSYNFQITLTISAKPKIFRDL